MTDGIMAMGPWSSFLFGRETFRRETARQWAKMMAEAEFLGLRIDDPQRTARKIADLDRGALEATARRHLDPAKLRVTVGPQGGRGTPKEAVQLPRRDLVSRVSSGAD